MLDNIDEIMSKFTNSTLKNLNKDNFYKILLFLKKQNCECIDDIVEDYIDIFIIEYEEFVKKYSMLNKKYNGNYLNLVNEDMNYLEEMFMDYN